MSQLVRPLSSASRRLALQLLSPTPPQHQCLFLLPRTTTGASSSSSSGFSRRYMQTVTPHRPDSLDIPHRQLPRNKNAPRNELLGGPQVAPQQPFTPPPSPPSPSTTSSTSSSSLSTAATSPSTSTQLHAASVSSQSSATSTSQSSTPRQFKLRPRKAAITLTPVAVEHLKDLLSQPEPKLIRIGVKNRGCSGLAYHLEYVEKPGRFDEEVVQDGVKVLIDSKALFSIIGSEMDWSEDKLSARFVFKNPNIKEQCGCGESFMV